MINNILAKIQNELKAPKNQKNNFGNYKYRSCEDILEAVKPLLVKHEASIVLSDEIVCLGDNHPCVVATSQSIHPIKIQVEEGEHKTVEREEHRIIEQASIGGGARFYVKATATLKCGEEEISVSAFARESKAKKGMDTAQITGAASSYARKYALNGLFAIDDTKDSDFNNNSK